MPASTVVAGLLPALVLGDRKERHRLLALGDLDDRRDELDKEARDLEKAGEEVVEEVDDEALDVGAIVVL